MIVRYASAARWLTTLAAIVRSASAARCLVRLAAAGAALLASAPPAAAALHLEPWKGHLQIGYAQLFIADAPGGSFAAGGGVDYPVTPCARVGVDVGYHLLGTRTVDRGSLTANVDYSLFEAAALLHLATDRLGPVSRVSVGPSLMAARASISATGGGAGFLDLAVDKVVAGAVLEGTWLSHAAPVRLGFELGVRVAFVPSETWAIATARLAVHY